MPVPIFLEGFDVPGAVGRMLDQPELWWQSLGLFVDHFADWENEWLASVGDDTLEVKKVHAVASAAANVGAIRLMQAARELEGALRRRLASGHEVELDILRSELGLVFRQSWIAADMARRSERFQPAVGQ